MTSATELNPRVVEAPVNLRQPSKLQLRTLGCAARESSTSTLSAVQPARLTLSNHIMRDSSMIATSSPRWRAFLRDSVRMVEVGCTVAAARASPTFTHCEGDTCSRSSNATCTKQLILNNGDRHSVRYCSMVAQVGESESLIALVKFPEASVRPPPTAERSTEANVGALWRMG